MDAYGETRCGALRERFAEEQGAQNARLVEIVAQDTLDIIEAGPRTE